MNVSAIYQFFDFLNKDKQCFVYSGNFNDSITEKIINLSETKLKKDDGMAKMSNKVSFLMAECFQNIVRHGGGEDFKEYDQDNTGFFITRNINDFHYIASANLVTQEVSNILNSQLQQLNNLDKDELKAMYLDVLANKELSHKGGAGLGLIEMARKSDKKLTFGFENVTDTLSFFYLQMIIKSKFAEEIHDKDEPKVAGLIELRQRIMDNQVLMIHKGDFSQDALVPILKMIEGNMRHHKGKYHIKKKIYHLLVEVLQNISRHSYTTDGVKEAIFLVGKQNDLFDVNAGNYINNSEIDSLKAQLDYLNTLDNKQKETYYLETLKNGVISEKGGAGLGMIDISKESRGPLEYSFTPVDDQRSFYSLHVKL